MPTLFSPRNQLNENSLLFNRKFGQFRLPPNGISSNNAIDSALVLQRLEAEMKAEMSSPNWNDSRLAHYQHAINYFENLILQAESDSINGIFDELKRVVNTGARTGITDALQNPQIALCFLYGFIPDGPFEQNKNATDHISKLPPIFREKKAKQVRLYQWIVSNYKLRDPEFWQPIRSTLTKFFGMSPEAFLNRVLSDNIADKEAVISGFVSNTISLFSTNNQASTVASKFGINIPGDLTLDSIKPAEELQPYLTKSGITLKFDTPIDEPGNLLDTLTVKEYPSESFNSYSPMAETKANNIVPVVAAGFIAWLVFK